MSAHETNTSPRYRYIVIAFDHTDKPTYNQLTAVGDSDALQLALRDMPKGTVRLQLVVTNTIAEIDLPTRRTIPETIHTQNSDDQ